MVKKQWIYTNSKTPEKAAAFVGKTGFTFGVITIPSRQTPFASYLAGTINDATDDSEIKDPLTYSVSCVMNPRNYSSTAPSL